MKKSRKKQGSTSKGFFKIFLILIFVFVAGFFIYHRLDHQRHRGHKTARHSKTARKEIKLYVASEEGLKVVRRSIKKGSLKSEINETFTILLWADSGTAIPKGTKLIGVKIKGDNAIVNINKVIVDKHPGGTSAEMQTIYSIVNSITLNYPTIKRVKILIEGKTRKTLAGHIDISIPLGPYRTLIQDS